MRWWLISDESVDIIRTALERRTELLFESALVELDTGLNRTPIVPDDWSEHGETLKDYVARHKGLKGT